jgi:hypothetical protein
MTTTNSFEVENVNSDSEIKISKEKTKKKSNPLTLEDLRAVIPELLSSTTEKLQTKIDEIVQDKVQKELEVMNNFMKKFENRFEESIRTTCKGCGRELTSEIENDVKITLSLMFESQNHKNDRSKLGWSEWVELAERQFKSEKLCPCKWMSVIEKGLDAEGIRTYNSFLQKIKGQSIDDQEKWIQFKSYMECRFTPEGDITPALIKYFDTVQKEYESIESYYQRFQYRHSLVKVDTDEVAGTRFIIGLSKHLPAVRYNVFEVWRRKSLRKSIKDASTYPNLDECYAIARESLALYGKTGVHIEPSPTRSKTYSKDKLKSSEKVNLKKKKSGVCFGCGKPGHMRNKCPEAESFKKKDFEEKKS